MLERDKLNRGFALVTALVMAAIIASTAMLLHSMVTVDLQITRNVLLRSKALSAAKSGMAHFSAMGYHYEDVSRLGVIQISGQTTSREKYIVTAVAGEEPLFYVRSVGKYEKRGKPISSAIVNATFKSFWVKDENLN